jgi:hypothetical protein
MKLHGCVCVCACGRGRGRGRGRLHMSVYCPHGTSQARGSL